MFGDHVCTTSKLTLARQKRRQSCFWVFAVVFQSFKHYFVPSTFPNKGISVYVLKKYGTFIHSILYTHDFLACWQISHHNIEKKGSGTYRETP